MAAPDPIWARAREDLIVIDDQGQAEVFLWEHSERVARCATEGIPALPDVPAEGLNIDALAAAALYHDAGWAVEYRDGTVSRGDICNRGTSRPQRELAVDLMRTNLREVLAAGSLQQACDWVMQMDRGDADTVEARILADAENLDQIGALLYWRIVRRQALEGKGVKAAIETWETHKQYSFWESRIEAIHFKSVRDIAHARLQRFDRFMDELARQHSGADLAGAHVAGLDHI